MASRCVTKSLMNFIVHRKEIYQYVEHNFMTLSPCQNWTMASSSDQISSVGFLFLSEGVREGFESLQVSFGIQRVFFKLLGERYKPISLYGILSRDLTLALGFGHEVKRWGKREPFKKGSNPMLCMYLPRSSNKAMFTPRITIIL